MSDELNNPGETAPAGPLLPPGMGPAGPVIPPPPPGRGQPRKKAADLRWLVWLGALGLGIAIGISAYQWLPGVDGAFDYWAAILLS